ncbi:hypothetical protein CN055_09110 [Campylobacter coli]|nr:hypothetical protein [Campylobacter coli]
MSNKIENYPNIEKLQTILNELAFHQIHQAWIDKKIPQYSLIILERWAEFYPNTIKNLGMSDLMTLALPQTQMELAILESKEADKKREQGLTDMEILAEEQINLNQYIAIEPQIYNDLEKFTQLNKNKIENLEKEIVELKSITGDNTPKYKRKDYLEALREDNRIIMDEIEKMSKQKNYKSDFVPKSAKILEDLNKHNKILKDRELLI